MTIDVEALSVAVVDVVREAVAPLVARIAALEKQSPREGIQGQKGLDGSAGERGPQGERGEQGPAGLNGKDAEMPNLDDLVLRAVALLPTPKDGVDGKDGAPGPIGPEGPMGDALDGKDGAPGKDGPQGPAGKDGLGIREAFVTEEGALVLTMTDGSTKAAGRVVGASGQNGIVGRTGHDGKDGADGKDGLGFDDVLVEHDGERGFTIKFVRGDRVKDVGTFIIPSLIYRGIYTERQYEQGDVVTWAGSAWVAKETTTAKPGMPSPESRAWQLCVKSGRDGKDKK